MTERIAIVSSPRCGNTWLRCLLRDGLGMPDVAVHNYTDVGELPDRCLLQLHWYREPNFQAFLARNEFQVITMSRHPLDVLISVLHFVRYEPETAQWLGGNCNIPPTLFDASPAGNEFLEYALGFGAENLLSVSYQWWHESSAIKVRYEDLVANTEAELLRLARGLGHPAEPIVAALPANSIEMFKAMPNRHGWQGRPGLWREVVPAESALRIFARYPNLFQVLGYSAEAGCLTSAAAEVNWQTVLT